MVHVLAISAGNILLQEYSPLCDFPHEEGVRTRVLSLLGHLFCDPGLRFHLSCLHIAQISGCHQETGLLEQSTSRSADVGQVLRYLAGNIM